MVWDPERFKKLEAEVTETLAGKRPLKDSPYYIYRYNPRDEAATIEKFTNLASRIKTNYSADAIWLSDILIDTIRLLGLDTPGGWEIERARRDEVERDLRRVLPEEITICGWATGQAAKGRFTVCGFIAAGISAAYVVVRIPNRLLMPATPYPHRAFHIATFTFQIYPVLLVIAGSALLGRFLDLHFRRERRGAGIILLGAFATLYHTYAGATREANVMSGTRALGATEMTMVIIFDKMTGIVCEVFFSVSSTQGDWVTTMSNRMELTATNAWGATGIPEIGGISGAIGLLSLVVLGQPFAKTSHSPPKDQQTPGMRGVNGV